MAVRAEIRAMVGRIPHVNRLLDMRVKIHEQKSVKVGRLRGRETQNSDPARITAQSQRAPVV